MFTFEWSSCPDGNTPNSGLTGLNNTYIYIYIYKQKIKIYAIAPSTEKQQSSGFCHPGEL